MLRGRRMRCVLLTSEIAAVVAPSRSRLLEGLLRPRPSENLENSPRRGDCMLPRL